MTKEIKIAALLTSFNRKEKTYSSINTLVEIDKNVDIYLTDDNSTDGTFELISKEFPQVKIINGTGDLYWNRGMHLAWEKASEIDYDFFIWLNDDVKLLSSSIEELIKCYRMNTFPSIITGIIVDDNGNTIYGGYDSKKKLISANGQLNPVRYLNGNVVLVSKQVFEVLGNLDPKYHHDLGDVDYGLRAIQNEIPVFTSLTNVGIGESNPICRERMNNVTIKERMKRLYSPLGSNPFINFYHRKKHFSIFNAMLYFLFQHFLNLIPDTLNYALFKNKYQ